MRDADELDDLLAQVPPALRRELLKINEEDAFGIARHFLASPEDQEGMMSFIESDGPRRVREVVLKHREGVPTAADLREQYAGECR